MSRKLRRVVIKEEFIELTGDFISAIILNQFLYWTDILQKSDEQLLEEKKRAEQNGKQINLSQRDGWIYKTAKQMLEEIMINTSEKTVERRIKDLVKAGFLESRNNPEYKWDRTMQYKVNLENVQAGLRKIGCSLEGYRLSDRNDTVTNGKDTVSDASVMMSDRTGHSVGTIPEITTEITTKITTKIHDDDEDNKGAVAPFSPRILHIGETELWVHDQIDKLYAHYFKAEANNEQIQFLLKQIDKGITVDGIAWAMRETRKRAKEWPYCMKVLENFGDIRTAEEAERRKQKRNQEEIIRSQEPVSEPETEETPPKRIPYKQIVDYLNEKTGKAFKSNRKATQQKIRARFNEGFTLEDFFTVIDKKVAQWLHDEEMCSYLRPDTLFSTKFESYLNEVVPSNKPAFQNAESKQAKKDGIPDHILEQLERQKATVSKESVFDPKNEAVSDQEYEKKLARMKELLKAIGEEPDNARTLS